MKYAETLSKHQAEISQTKKEMQVSAASRLHQIHANTAGGSRCSSAKHSLQAVDVNPQGMLKAQAQSSTACSSINMCLPRVRCKAHDMLSTACSAQQTRADAPSRVRALASAGLAIYAGNHWGMPCTVGLSRLDQIMLSTACSAQRAQHTSAPLPICSMRRQ